MTHPTTLPETRTAASSLPPLATGLPVLGNALDMRIDPLAYFLDLYHRFGPVFRIRLPGREVWILAGIEANRVLARSDGEALTSGKLFGGVAEQFGSDALLVALDGVPHRHQRKIQRRGFSRETILRDLATVVSVTEQTAGTWAPGTTIPLFPMFQRLVTEQLGLIIIGRPIGDRFDDLFTLTSTVMNVEVLKMWPRIVLRLPHYRRARARILAFGGEILAWLRANPPGAGGREPNLIDDLMAATDENGRPYSDAMLKTVIIGGFFAGLDTVAATASFMTYAILKTPGLKARVLEEVDRVFDSGGLTPDALRNMDVLHHTAIETLRYYPIAPFTPRTVAQAFTFAGYTFQPGTEVMFAQTVTHFLPEHFPNPHTFDIDRYAQPDAPKPGQAFAPYTLGAHTCLGAGMAEVQLMSAIATLFRTVDLALEPADAEITLYANPIPNPGRRFGVRVVGPRKGV
jgi:cytochrome P450